MNTYEIVNPSDKVTFLAPDDAVARAATLLVGSGNYGLRDVTDGKSMNVHCMLLFTSEQATERLLAEWFGPGSLKAFLDARWPEVAAALASAQNLDAAHRKDYEEAIAGMTKEKAEKYRREVEDRHRSSLNQIVKYAWSLAKRTRKAEESK